MLFKNPAPLSFEVHKEYLFNASSGWEFASSASVVPVSVSEATKIAREYPLLFPRAKNMMPLALLGLEQGVNYHIDPSGRWRGRYIPAHVRRYPFMLGKQGELMIDETAPHLGHAAGQPLFTDTGDFSDEAQRAKRVLDNLQKDFQATASLVNQIEEAGILVERDFRAEPRNRNPLVINGFRGADTEKIMGLSAETLKSLMQTGALLLLHAHWISLTNLKDGVIVMDLPKPREPDPGFSLSNEGELDIDWDKFKI